MNTVFAYSDSIFSTLLFLIVHIMNIYPVIAICDNCLFDCLFPSSCPSVSNHCLQLRPLTSVPCCSYAFCFCRLCPSFNIIHGSSSCWSSSHVFFQNVCTQVLCLYNVSKVLDRLLHGLIVSLCYPTDYQDFPAVAHLRNSESVLVSSALIVHTGLLTILGTSRVSV